jgi:gluconokinase
MASGPAKPVPKDLPSIILVMGVSGSGKSTIGSLLARELGWKFQDGDQFHPAANVEKMHARIPLTDADRQPWLLAIAAFIDRIRDAQDHAVVACSALKRRYRQVLIGHRRDVRLVYLKGNAALIAERLAGRHGHFMPPELLDSQFQALEEPGPDENPIAVSIARSPQTIVAQILACLSKVNAS